MKRFIFPLQLCLLAACLMSPMGCGKSEEDKQPKGPINTNERPAARGGPRGGAAPGGGGASAGGAINKK